MPPIPVVIVSKRGDKFCPPMRVEYSSLINWWTALEIWNGTVHPVYGTIWGCGPQLPLNGKSNTSIIINSNYPDISRTAWGLIPHSSLCLLMKRAGEIWINWKKGRFVLIYTIASGIRNCFEFVLHHITPISEPIIYACHYGQTRFLETLILSWNVCNLLSTRLAVTRTTIPAVVRRVIITTGTSPDWRRNADCCW
jgi:hypothetical protein